MYITVQSNRVHVTFAMYTDHTEPLSSSHFNEHFPLCPLDTDKCLHSMTHFHSKINTTLSASYNRAGLLSIVLNFTDTWSIV